MIIIHHLADSRSQRVLWLLEELGLQYEVKRYERDPNTRLAPPELKAVHPLGKSPVLQDADVTVAETGSFTAAARSHHISQPSLSAAGAALARVPRTTGTISAVPAPFISSRRLARIMRVLPRGSQPRA